MSAWSSARTIRITRAPARAGGRAPRSRRPRRRPRRGTRRTAAPARASPPGRARRPGPRPAAVGAALTTSTSTEPSTRRTCTRVGAPPAWRRTLVSASWTIRYAARSMPAGRPSTSPSRVSSTGTPVARTSSTSRSRPASVGWGVYERLVLAQHVQQAAHLGERLRRRPAHRADVLAGAGRVAVDVGLGGPRLDGDDRHGVGDHVVELARDAGALLGDRLAGPLAALGPGGGGLVGADAHHAARPPRGGDEEGQDRDVARVAAAAPVVGVQRGQHRRPPAAPPGGSARASGPHVAGDRERGDEHRRERHDAVVRGVGGRDPHQQSRRRSARAPGSGSGGATAAAPSRAAPPAIRTARVPGPSTATASTSAHTRDGPGDRQVDRLRHAQGALDAGDRLHARIVGGAPAARASSRGRIRVSPWSHAVAPRRGPGRDRRPTRRTGGRPEASPRRRHGPSRTGGAPR